MKFQILYEDDTYGGIYLRFEDATWDQLTALLPEVFDYVGNDDTYDGNWLATMPLDDARDYLLDLGFEETVGDEHAY